ncbi:hypothetical protein CEXT_430041 [Caerostris extrusa]|uniref:Uncharacterized protein n=1 Tax=Caerostris extrusa TaxID=172846 RepID=A0AAV4U5B6_CAEEX|nr:hypothetical protein CEXT_430041 [Caerostris extrusa]
MSKIAMWQERPGKFFNDRNQPARVEEVIQNDRRVTLREISLELGLRFGSLQHIISDVLRHFKVCARWVPHALSDEHRANTNHVQSHISSALPF